MTPLVVAILAMLVLAWFALGYRVANLLLYPPRQPIARTPTEVGLPFEEVTFPAKDRLPLKGWWIPAADSEHSAAPVVILLHPLFGNRHGLAGCHQSWPLLLDATLDLLGLAMTFHGVGYSVLTFDFRCHGESLRALCGGGFTEDQDVMGAVDYLFQRLKPDSSVQIPHVGVVGFGLGAVAALAALGREKGGTEVIRVFSGDSAGGSGFVTIPPMNVKYLRFLIAVQPVSSDRLLRTCARQPTALLVRTLLPLVNRLCQERGGFPLGVTPMIRFVREVNVPVLYVEAASKSGEAQRIYDNLPGQKQRWVVDDVDSCGGLYAYVVQHPSHLLEFAGESIAAGRPH